MQKEINISDTGKIADVEKPNTKTAAASENIPPQAVTQNQSLETNNDGNTGVKTKFNFKILLFPITALIVLCGIAAFYYFGIYKLKTKPLESVLSFNSDYISSIASSNIFSKLPLLSSPEEPRTEVSPINGLLFTKTEMDTLKTKRPIAVMIDNQVDARPQSGVDSADVVIEANAEGGITRLMAIFWSKAPTQVGPIRSMREYFLEWLSEYDPIVIHDGCASSDDPRINACGNLYSFGTKDIATIGAWRSSEGGTKVAPHNEFSSLTYAWEYGKKLDWDSFPSAFESWKFKRDADMDQRGDKTQVKLTFHTRLNNNGLYDVIWTYDKSSNLYYRKVGGQPSVDALTNSQITAKDVVVQEISMVQSGDVKGHLIITTTGQGKATFLMDGKITYGTWKKTSRTDRTTYYDSDGNEVNFNRGKIWVEMLSQTDGEFDIIEQ